MRQKNKRQKERTTKDGELLLRCLAGETKADGPVIQKLAKIFNERHEEDTNHLL